MSSWMLVLLTGHFESRTLRHLKTMDAGNGRRLQAESTERALHKRQRFQPGDPVITKGGRQRWQSHIRTGRETRSVCVCVSLSLSLSLSLFANRSLPLWFSLFVSPSSWCSVASGQFLRGVVLLNSGLGAELSDICSFGLPALLRSTSEAAGVCSSMMGSLFSARCS